MKLKFYMLSMLSILTMSLTAIVGCDDDDEAGMNNVTFQMEVKNVTDEYADVFITPSNETVTYFADIAPVALFDSLTEEGIVKRVSNMIDDRDLVQGSKTFSPSKPLLPNTEYYAFALGYKNGAPQTVLSKQAFKTNEPTKPVIETTYTYEYSAFQYVAHCASKDAVDGAFVELATEDLEKALAQGATLWELVNPENGISHYFADYELEDLNGDYGFRWSYIDAPGKTFSYVIWIDNAKGGREIRRDDIFLGNGTGGKAPSVEVTGTINKDLNAVDFLVKVPSGDATYIGQVSGDSAYIDEGLNLNYDGSIEAMLSDTYCWKWFAEDIKKANTDEGTHVYLGSMQGLQYGMTGSLILDVMTMDCGRTIVRKNVYYPTPQEQKGEEPTLIIEDAAPVLLSNDKKFSEQQMVHDKWSKRILPKFVSKDRASGKLPCLLM